MLNVSWERPDFPNGILTNYTVSLEPYGSESALQSKETDNETLFTTFDISGLSELVVPQWSAGAATVV